ncbi:diguanylate cyclase (GGDEF) domain-containing protein [Octadecabacter temperatus]|uniref:diguanylate cyclase n=1 Tax=Octadecabacter temperatus TaxID=1458307 RepID=A0A0K0Y5L2_9RHOB|nr:diguanylate cyclase [Octadecabacter temperatus]AKS46254.1 Diguanylate cyclase DosC [Octadecabacter temperatus]SIO10620.1 diguanylate cyclase (GGDEF) domain-containing protein [Octadecabacter temperatus]
MTKSEAIDDGELVSQSLSWRDSQETDDAGLMLATQIMNVMEQGIILWSADGTCELHNTRIYEVLELERSALGIGTNRDEFLAAAVPRGEYTDEKLAEMRKHSNTRIAYQYDRKLPSGDVVECHARPTREGGYVVTCTNVTEARQAARELAAAKKAAEDAESKSSLILQEERARRAEARTLSDLDEWLQSCKSLDELFQIVAKFMGYLLPDSYGELYLYSNSRDVLDGACEWGQEDAINAHITPDSCWSLRRGRVYEHNPDALCFPCDHLSEQSKATLCDYICIPIIAHGDTVGLLHINFKAGMSRAEIKSLGRFAARCGEHISMAIANVKLRDELHDQSIRDPLTGLYNRRYFMDAMRRETSVADRGGKGFSLISLDADKFKTFNDNHGHEAGDLVLRALAECMLAVLPSSAVCARVGGEEFAVLLPQCIENEAMQQAEALRSSVSEIEVRTAFGLLPRVTISSGVAAYCGDSTAPSVVMKRADEALYAAKSDGRNCVRLAKTGTREAVTPVHS